MTRPDTALDAEKFINPAQVGGVESYVLDDGAGRATRALCVNTGAGLRYRVLVDRGLDIDHASFDHHNLAFLTHNGATAPTRALDRGLDWLKGFPGGLLTTCGPNNIGAPANDAGEDVGLHGPHSNTPAELETVQRPDPHAGRREILVRGVLRYGAFYGPNMICRRTIRSVLGSNRIDFTDEITNAGNTAVPHAWLLHINFGYPLLDEGAEFCYDAARVEPHSAPASQAYFVPAPARAQRPAGTAGKRARSAASSASPAARNQNTAALPAYKRVQPPGDEWAGDKSVVAYLYPKPHDRQGSTTVAIVNPKLNLAVAVHYNTRDFPRCTNWQHYGQREYVAALEPSNGGVEGRNVDRQRGWLDTLGPAATKTYRYALEVVTDAGSLAALRQLNRR
jgi:hypothetical protein